MKHRPGLRPLITLLCTAALSCAALCGTLMLSGGHEPAPELVLLFTQAAR